MKRRDFIKHSCLLCSAFGAGIAMSSISSCAPSRLYKTEMQENKIAIPLFLFAQNNLQIVRVKNYSYDIAVRKIDENNFLSLMMRCTHADNQLMNNGNGFNCILHGSVFAADGSVKKGPAETPLKKFITEKVLDQIVIHLN